MTMTVEKAQLNNQSILQNFGLVEEIDAQSAEKIIVKILFGRFICKKKSS